MARQLDSALQTMERGPWSTNAAESRQLRLLSLRVANGYDRAVGLRRRIEDITAGEEHEAWAAAEEEERRGEDYDVAGHAHSMAVAKAFKLD